MTKQVKSFVAVVHIFVTTVMAVGGQKPWDHGNLVVDGHMVKHADNTPFFWMGDTVWDLTTKLNQAETVTYMANRSNKKYTVTQLSALSWRGLRTQNVFTNEAFIGGNISSPNEPYWQHLDYVIEQAKEKGLYVGLLPVWGGTHVRNDNNFNVQTAESYGEFIGNRYKNSLNIIWIMGGDTSGQTDIWNAMAQGIKSVDSNHLMTFHPSRESSPEYHNEPWLDFNMIQSGHHGKFSSLDKIPADYNLSPVKPTIDGEPRYEEIVRGLDAGLGTGDYIEDFEVREVAYWQLFSGAFGHTYGHSALWKVWKQGDGVLWGKQTRWQDAMNHPGSTQMQYVSELMQSRPILSRVPDQSLISGDAGVDSSHIQATRGDGYAFIYIPNGRNFTVQMGKISGANVKAWWYNPRDGQASVIGTFTNSGTRDFDPSGEPKRGNDWVLVLDDTAKGYGEPGVIGGYPKRYFFKKQR